MRYFPFSQPRQTNSVIYNMAQNRTLISIVLLKHIKHYFNARANVAQHLIG